MAANLYNVDVPDAVITQALTLLTQLETLLKPYFVTISEEQKKHTVKISDKTIPFATKADAYIGTEPKYNPPFIDINETHKDFKNFLKLNPVMQKIQGLDKEISNMDIAAGSDALIQFLAYYASVQKAAEMGVPGAKPIYDELATRFPGRKKGNPPPPPAKP